MVENYLIIGFVALCFIVFISVVIFSKNGDQVHVSEIIPHNAVWDTSSEQVQRVVPGFNDHYAYSDFGLEQRGRDAQRR